MNDEITKTVLNGVMYSYNQFIDREHIRDNQFLIDSEEYGRQIGLKFFMTFWQEAKRHDIKKIRYPADWWQAFKERWFNDWLKDRYPVKYTVVTVDGAFEYYKLDQALPEDNQSRLVMFTQKGYEYGKEASADTS